MIKIIKAHIEEFRGIRKLEIDLLEKNFSISGPNGSGKSGVIDAIEFCLTGSIGRLSGTGTSGLTLGDHGPHVDMTDFPDAAFVELEVSLPALSQPAKITRKVSQPRRPKIEPDIPEVREALEGIERHPEITLARRDILRFILVGATERSKEIQMLLRLDEIEKTRTALGTASRKLRTKFKQSEAGLTAARDGLVRHTNLAAFRSTDLLDAVNAKRSILSLPELREGKPETRLDEGLEKEENEQAFNKQSAIRDLEELRDLLTNADFGRAQVESIIQSINTLDADPALLRAVHKKGLLDKGIELVDGPCCPLCDLEWPSQSDLIAHLRAKIEKSENAAQLIEGLRVGAEGLAQNVAKLREVLLAVHGLAKATRSTDFESSIVEWGKALNEFNDSLGNTDKILLQRERLESDWRQTPAEFAEQLKALSELVEALPDQTDKMAAHTFLSTAQDRLNDYRKAARQRDLDEFSNKMSEIAYAEYCAATEDKLVGLYEEVKEDFSRYYRILNGDDEQKFTAKLTPAEGKLDFDVNFYGRGLFPPGAFHSEGHQDGMGVCLYLALMKRLLGEGFSLALLDDVVMSVDKDHRRQFCHLLNSEFPDTQFVIATHDRVWAEQMKKAGLVTSKTSLAFHSWSVETGPLVESNADVWEDISQSLDKNKVETAAHTLRRHLEFAFAQIADNLGARVAFKSDGNYDLGELMPSSIAQLRTLYSRASDAAQSWKNQEGIDLAKQRKDALKEANTHRGEEDWVVNKAIHHNEWADFGKNDLLPVVEAFKELLDCFLCDSCGSLLEVSPRGPHPSALRCRCAKVNMNLAKK